MVPERRDTRRQQSGVQGLSRAQGGFNLLRQSTVIEQVDSMRVFILYEGDIGFWEANWEEQYFHIQVVGMAFRRSQDVG